MSHLHVMYQQRSDGRFDIYAMQYLATVDKAEIAGTCPNPMAPAKQYLDDKGRAKNIKAQDKMTVDSLLDMRSLDRDLYGDGVNLLSKLNTGAAPDQVLLSSDPRIFAIGLSKTMGGPRGMGFPTSGMARAEAERIAVSTDGRSKRTDVNVREVRTPDFGITSSDLAEMFVFRITGKGRGASTFNTESEPVFINMPGDKGNNSGIYLLLFDKKGRKYRNLEPADDLAAAAEYAANMNYAQGKWQRKDRDA